MAYKRRTYQPMQKTIDVYDLAEWLAEGCKTKSEDGCRWYSLGCTTLDDEDVEWAVVLNSDDVAFLAYAPLNRLIKDEDDWDLPRDEDGEPWPTDMQSSYNQDDNMEVAEYFDRMLTEFDERGILEDE